VVSLSKTGDSNYKSTLKNGFTILNKLAFTTLDKQSMSPSYNPIAMANTAERTVLSDLTKSFAITEHSTHSPYKVYDYIRLKQ